MTSNLRRWLVAAAILVAVGSLLSVTPGKVVAQIRAALVKNVDEPGRIPWDTRSQFLPNAGGCYGTSDCFNYSDGTTFATFDLRPVPAGKRWVVQMATGGMVNGATRTATNIELLSPRGAIVFDGLRWGFAGPYLPGTSFSSTIFSASLFATFGPGETPTVRVTGLPNLGGYTVIVFNGYLIDATN